MEISLSKTAEENLLVLINTSNQSTGLVVDLTKVSMSGPVALSNVSEPLNTAITLTALQRSGWKDTTVVKYRRCSISEGKAVAPSPVAVTEVLSQQAAFNMMTALFGVLPSEVSINNGGPTEPGTQQTVRLSVKPNSLLYLPGFVDLLFSWAPVGTDISTVAGAVTLTGFRTLYGSANVPAMVAG